ncbi:MAG: ABC transporter permease [Pirellulales bacterium]|nr:ABC transporter permease [Pirellulales bacterium]
MSSALLLADRFIWLTPSWLFAMGILAGLMILLLLWGVARLASPAVGRWLWDTATEGVLLPIFATAAVISVYALMVLVAAITFESKQLNVGTMATSLSRVLANDNLTQTVPLKPSEKNRAVVFDASPVEIAEVHVTPLHNAELMLVLPGDPAFSPFQPRTIIDPKQTYTWKRSGKQRYYFTGEQVKFYLTNNTNLDNPVEVRLVATAEHPQVAAIPATALVLISGVLAYFLFSWLFPRISAVANTTMKEAIYQPIYGIVLCLILAFIFIQLVIPLYTFGEDIKGYKENVLTVLTVFSLLVAIWTASNTIADEIDGRTALTVLSKPISRLEFVVGKYFGVLFPVMILFLIGSLFFIGCIPFKMVYDSRESSQLNVSWQQGYEEIRTILPGLALTLMQIMCLTSISVAISTRLSMLVNMIITLTIYVLGNLLPQLVQSSRIGTDYNLDKLVEFSARFFATIFPTLETYNIHAAITAGQEVPLQYLGLTLVYTLLYCGMALLVSLLLFEDRDLS